MSSDLGEIKITKHARVDAPKEDQDLGIVAFQYVDFEIEFYGNKLETSHDTKIMEDGTQIVIDGDGFIPCGYRLDNAPN